MPSGPQTVISYLKEQLQVADKNFLTEWKNLSKEDQMILRQWAEEEMSLLGIQVLKAAK